MQSNIQACTDEETSVKKEREKKKVPMLILRNGVSSCMAAMVIGSVGDCIICLENKCLLVVSLN